MTSRPSRRLSTRELMHLLMVLALLLLAFEGASNIGVLDNASSATTTCAVKIHASRIDTPGTALSSGNGSLQNNSGSRCNINVGASHLEGGSVQQSSPGTIRCTVIYNDSMESYEAVPTSSNNFNCPRPIG